MCTMQGLGHRGGLASTLRSNSGWNTPQVRCGDSKEGSTACGINRRCSCSNIARGVAHTHGGGACPVRNDRLLALPKYSWMCAALGGVHLGAGWLHTRPRCNGAVFVAAAATGWLHLSSGCNGCHTPEKHVDNCPPGFTHAHDVAGSSTACSHCSSIPALPSSRQHRLNALVRWG